MEEKVELNLEIKRRKGETAFLLQTPSVEGVSDLKAARALKELVSQVFVNDGDDEFTKLLVLRKVKIDESAGGWVRVEFLAIDPEVVAVDHWHKYGKPRKENWLYKILRYLAEDKK